MRRAALPASWARDPFGRYPHRLFDGRAWTDRVARGGRTLNDTFLMGSPSPAPELPTTCDECGFDVGDAKFCPRCGTPASPPARPPYCYQCSASPPPGAAFCHECGSRLDALAPGLSVQDADQWRRVFGAIGWRKDSPDRDRAYQDSLKKISRRGGNLPALLRSMDLPAFDGEDPSEPWVLWLALSEQRRAPWMVAQHAEVLGGEEPAKVETLIITRCRLVALTPSGLASSPALALADSLANIASAEVANNTLRVRFGTSGRELQLGWKVTNRPSPLTPADLRALASGGPEGGSSVGPTPLRRASDRRDGGRYVSEAVVGAFARRLAAISG